jgi:hypothetical protein
MNRKTDRTFAETTVSSAARGDLSCLSPRSVGRVRRQPSMLNGMELEPHPRRPYRRVEHLQVLSQVVSRLCVLKGRFNSSTPVTYKPKIITMKKTTFALVSLFALLRIRSHQSSSSRSPPSPAPVAPVDTSSVVWGAFLGTTKPLGQYQAEFIGDGDSFTEDTQGFTLPRVVYWESKYTASQIAGGKTDSFLKSWAAQMKSYGHTIIFVVMDEMNLRNSSSPSRTLIIAVPPWV